MHSAAHRSAPSHLRFLLLSVFLVLLAASVGTKRVVTKRCPPACTCSKDSIICVGSNSVPRVNGNDVNSLSIVNATFSDVKEANFAHLPSLQLLLLNSNALTTLRDDAFAGLPHLEYLFIENNKLETISRHAFRGLRDLTHLSLANNKIKVLPRDLFNDLDSLIELDLRGNALVCDCRIKWFVQWERSTNASVPDVYCAAPDDMKGRRLNDLANMHHECMTTDFVLYQSIPVESLSVDAFTFKKDVYVAVAATTAQTCMLLQWDHIEMHFRHHDNITGQSIVGCKSVLIEDQLFLVVAQLFGGTHIYRFDSDLGRFATFQAIEAVGVSKPNDIETFRVGGDTFFVIADSSKAGKSRLYRWNVERGGFYTHQELHAWFRDTDAEYVDLDGKAHLLLASRSQVPVIYQWNRGSQQFVLQGEIPNMEDVVAVKAFRVAEGDDHNNAATSTELYLALTRYIGDSKVLRWAPPNTFTELQALPSRGSMVLQPFACGGRHYLALGSDYTFSRIYAWNATPTGDGAENQDRGSLSGGKGERRGKGEDGKGEGRFGAFKEVYIQAPRSFTAVSTETRDFLFASSFKGNTQIYEHVLIDLSV